MFFDDCSEGAHPEILQCILDHNSDQQRTYGEDDYCTEAIRRIRKTISDQTAEIHFVSGGTQANLIAIASMLKPYEGIIAPTSGHISIHESGAIEATGHKVIPVPHKYGKLTIENINLGLATYENEHTVKPAAVFVTQLTERGTAYTKKELQAIVAHSKQKGLFVYLDGARLAAAQASQKARFKLSDLPKMGIDMFCIGGTKNGALLGEAIVICNDTLKENFRHYLKQHGALLAKGRAIGLQFMRFFDTDNLWLELGKKSVENARALYGGLKKLGVKFVAEPDANQIFLILENSKIEKLKQDYGFHVWERYDDKSSVIRLVCSWATSQQAISTFLEDVKEVIK